MGAAVRKPIEGGATFPLANRLRRALWGLVWGAAGAWTPAPLHGWRRLLLRLFGAQLAASARVYPGVRVWDPANLRMGAQATLGRGVDCYTMAPIALGDYAVVSQGAYLCSGTHAVDDPDFPLQARPITVGPRAWIAAQAFVGPGVAVGEGAVLGARAVTMRDLEPWTIYAGNPARPLRRRGGGDAPAWEAAP